MDAMYYLRQKGNAHGFIIEATYQASGFEDFPRYYLGNWDEDYVLNSNYSAAQLKDQLKNSSTHPNYVIFLSDNNMDARIAKFKQSYPNIEQLTVILLMKTNPVMSSP
jgi:hypothetical protein